MERGKVPPAKRPVKGKGALPPPGDLFALGSKQSRSGSEPNLQKLASNPQTSDKKLGKRESTTSLLSQGLAPKKPKLLSQTQTFTPLGRPSEREIERRPSPVPPVSLQFEEAAIEADGELLLEEVLEAEDNSNYDKLEGLLCGAVKHLRANRSKPDQTVYLTLMYLAKFKPSVFNSAIVIEAFCNLLKRDMSLNFKSKGNSLVSVLACNVMMVAYNEEENWPDDFVKVYIDDALGERVWVDRTDCKGFVDNISSAFNTNLPKTGLYSLSDTGKGDQSGPASPGLFEDEDNKPMDVDTDKSSAGLVELQNIQVFPRYPYQHDNIESFVVEIIREQLSKRQPMDASAKNLLRLMTVTCGYSEVRQLAAQKLELWLQNPKLARVAQELLMSVCMNCGQNDGGDMEVIAQLIKYRMKTKPLINHYLSCIRELLGQHVENMRMVLTHTIYNELSTARNPNNMALIGVVFQCKPEEAAKMLAEIFQDLLVNKDDYLRALRALFREIVRSLRHDINFTEYCLGLMQERTEAKFTEMEVAFKERYVASVTDLIALTILQAITPSLREAVAAISKGDRKDVEILYNYQQQVSIIQRDAVWWLHTVVPKFVDSKPVEYVHCLHKVLLMESPEHYCKDNWPAETDRGPMLRLASECPVLEDTLMRVLVIGLSRELPLNPPDAIELADSLVKRAANLHAEGRPVIQVERLELVNALLNLCTYRHPENIALPAGYSPPTLAISNHYWKAWVILLIISAFNPATFGLAAWKNYPTLKCLMEMVMTSNYKFPPPTTAVDDSTVEEVRNKEKQVALQEKQLILEFESYLAASSTKVTITEANSLLVAQLTTMDPVGIARRPPQTILDQIRNLNDNLKIGQMLCRSRNPDFLLDIIQRQGTSQSMPWLADLVDSNEGSLDVLPVQCLCEFLLHESTETSKDSAQDEDAVKFERHKKKQKLKKQEQLLSRLQALVHDSGSDSNTTYEVLDYFFKRLSSPQANARALATKGLSMVVSRSQLSPVDQDGMEVDTDTAEKAKHKWLLEHLPTLPMFPQVKTQTCAALRQACQIETNPSLVSAYIIFLSQHAMDHNLQELDELALDVAQLIVERTTVINYILPQEQGTRTVYSMDTLEALVYLFVNYLRKAKEPNTEGYTWSNTQDQIILQWETGESATMHILVVHAMIILLTYGPTSKKELYEELQETWFPVKSKPPSAFLLDTSEEALLLPDWLKLRMIRSSSSQLVAAALQDLDPAQLLLFVQSFGIPVGSMSKLLQCLDNAVTMDPVTLEQAVVDKAYMAQLIEVQHLRGANGGEKFYFMLTDGGALGQKSEESEMNESLSEDSRWKVQGQLDVAMDTVHRSQVVNTLLQTFNPSGRTSPDSDRHYQNLVMCIGGSDQAVVNIVGGLLEILAQSGGAEFSKSLLQSPKACSLFKLLISKQKPADLHALPQVMEKLSRFSAGQKSPLAAVIHQYLASQSKRDQKAKPDAKTQALRITDTKHFMEDLKSLKEDSNKVEMLVGKCMTDSMATKRLENGTTIACTALLQTQEQPRNKMLASTAALFIDWLELLDPEVIKLTPDLQEKLLFARQTVSANGNLSQTPGKRESNHPYLLALLTHQTSWSTLHRCINTVLKPSNSSRYNPSSVLDFLWACIHIPTIWQGRERKVPKNQSPEDVLGLNNDQLVSLVTFIVAEAAASEPVKSGDQATTNQVPASISNRMELLIGCICEDDSKVKLLTSHIESALKGKRDTYHLYQALLLELYLSYPYLMSWLLDSKHVTTDAQSTDRSHTQLDLISHRLLTSLYQGSHSKKNDARMLDANIACRKLAAEHPLLILRQLPVLVALLNGKTQFSFGEFRQRNFLTLFTYTLGLLELLQPQLFQKEYTALEDVLECYFTLLQTYAKDFRQLAPLIVKFVTFLHQFVSYDAQRASTILQKHVVLLGNVSSVYPDLSVLKSLLAGLSLPRKNQEEGTPAQGETNPVAVPARPSSPWTISHLAPFLQKIRKQNSEDVLSVLKDLDETSKRKIDILDHFQDDLKRLMETFDEQCRNLAFDLVKRFIRQHPRHASEFVPTYLHCMENSNPEIVNTALVNLAEFTLLCQDQADAILQKAFSIGMTTVTETSAYISESLQLMNLDISSH